MMFAVKCPTHGSTVLLTRRNVLSFWNGPDGPVISWKCNCGHEGFLDRRGSHPDPTRENDAEPTELFASSPERLAG
jgi:hypothetical protein